MARHGSVTPKHIVRNNPAKHVHAKGCTNMMGKTHTVFSGGVCGLLWVIATHPSSPVDAGVMVATTSIGGLLPDIDHPQATISRKNILFGALSRVISTFPWGKHRRVVHTVPFCALFGVVGFLLTRLFGQLALLGTEKIPISITEGNVTHVAILVGMGFFIGAIGHLLADMCNKEGVMLFWPISKNRISVLPITTSSPLEMLFLVATTLVVIGLALILVRQGYIPELISGAKIPFLTYSGK